MTHHRERRDNPVRAEMHSHQHSGSPCSQFPVPCSFMLVPSAPAPSPSFSLPRPSIERPIHHSVRIKKEHILRTHRDPNLLLSRGSMFLPSSLDFSLHSIHSLPLLRAKSCYFSLSLCSQSSTRDCVNLYTQNGETRAEKMVQY